MKNRLLIVEDEEEIIRLIVNRFDQQVYEITVAKEGKEAIRSIVKEDYDVAIIDFMLPYVDGFEVSRRLRQKSSETLIIIISALGHEENKIKGYGIGIDDFIAKPFSPKELAIKVDALLKRRYVLINGLVTSLKSIKHDRTSKKVFIHEHPLALTPSEYLIFSLLLSRPRHIVSRDEMSQAVYDHGFGEIDARGIDTHIYNIRKKIAHYTEEKIIRTERSLGYTLHEF